MARPKRPTPTGQMSLFGYRPDAKHQNGRWIITAAAQVEMLLQAVSRAPDDHYGRQTEIQRPLYKSHCDELARHYKQVPNWVIAPFVFTSDIEALDIKGGEFQDLRQDVILLDGQHRTQALHIAVEDLQKVGTADALAKRTALLESWVSLQFIENRGPADASQLFVDLNKGKRVSQAELAYLDGRDPIVNIIKDALETTEWVKERTDTSRTTPPASSDDVFTIGVLKTVLKAIETGIKVSIPAARRSVLATDDGRREAAATLAEFFAWLPTARVEYVNLQRVADLNVPDERTRHYAYDARFLVLLAETWARSKSSGPNPAALADRLQAMNITRNDPAGDLDRHLGLLDDRGRMKPFTRGPYVEASVRLRDTVQQPAQGAAS